LKHSLAGNGGTGELYERLSRDTSDFEQDLFAVASDEVSLQSSSCVEERMLAAQR